MNALFISSESGWGNGVWLIFFFGIGTWLGLYPLAIVGTMSGKLSKSMKNSSFQRIQQKLAWRKKKKTQDQTPQNAERAEEKTEKTENAVNYSKIEYFSAWSLIISGIVFLLLAIFQVDLIPEKDITSAPWPFLIQDNINSFWTIFFIILGSLILLIFFTFWWRNRKYMKSITTEV